MILGLFAKRVPKEYLPKINAVIDESFNALGAQINRHTFHAKNGDIKFTEPDERQRLTQAFQKIWSASAEDIGEFRRNSKQMVAHYLSDGVTAYEQAAFTFAIALAQMDLVCKAALEYPSDKDFKDKALKLTAVNLSAFDHIFDDQANSRQPLDFTPAHEVLDTLPYARVIFLPKEWQD